jgi:hypothetical protein
MSTPPLSLGSLTPWSNWGEYNLIAFIVQQLQSKLQTATLVRVEACSNDGGLSPVETVDITPLVNQIDGNGFPTPHVTIARVPYLRIQGGSNAVILDPQVGDTGVAVFASRDISKVKNTKAQANPGSFRRYDFADALYVGGMLNGMPQQYVCFNSDGIELVSPKTVTIKAPNISLDGELTVTGNIVAEADLTVAGTTTSDGVNLATHTHEVTAINAPTGPPLP